MSSYRFCRSDDIPLLCDAYNTCYRPHFPHLPELDVAAFKRKVRELNLWTSSCMVTLVDGRPAGVMLATKREDESLIWAIGVRTEHRRREHGRHMLESLSAKLAILGPPRLVAEVPADLAGALAFFEAAGYRRERELRDYVWNPDPKRQRFHAALVSPVTFAEVRDHGPFDSSVPCCWARTPQTLEQRGEAVRGAALAPADRIEAYVLYEEPGDGAPRKLLSLGTADPGRAEAMLGMLVRHVCDLHDTPVRFEGVAAEEVPREWLRQWGFHDAGGTVVLAATPRPA